MTTPSSPPSPAASPPATAASTRCLTTPVLRTDRDAGHRASHWHDVVMTAMRSRIEMELSLHRRDTPSAHSYHATTPMTRGGVHPHPHPLPHHPRPPPPRPRHPLIAPSPAPAASPPATAASQHPLPLHSPSLIAPSPAPPRSESARWSRARPNGRTGPGDQVSRPVTRCSPRSPVPAVARSLEPPLSSQPLQCPGIPGRSSGGGSSLRRSQN
jgi:hypothetical protein